VLQTDTAFVVNSEHAMHTFKILFLCRHSVTTGHNVKQAEGLMHAYMKLCAVVQESAMLLALMLFVLLLTLLPVMQCNVSRVAHTYCKLHLTTSTATAANDRCMNSAGADKSDVTYINAHGTSTAYNDKFETLAIKVRYIQFTAVCRHAVDHHVARFR
jgi:Beta-ketoacyl synthase, C-terminal domain